MSRWLDERRGSAGFDAERDLAFRLRWAAATIAAVLVVGLWIAVQVRDLQNPSGRLCRQRYNAASTFQDTQSVDAMIPYPDEYADAVRPYTCGDLRMGNEPDSM